MYVHKNTIQVLKSRISQGDSAALGELYKTSYSSLLRFGVQVHGAHQASLVEEQIQELFLWIAKNYNQLEQIKNLEAYLFQALRKRLMQAHSNTLQRKKVKVRYHHRTSSAQSFIRNSVEQDYLEAENQSEQVQKLYAAIQGLAPQQRAILHLRYFQGFDYEEIAEVLSLNQQVCRNYVHRAIKKLRKQILVLKSTILF